MFGFGKPQEQEKKWAEFEGEFAPYVKDIFRVALFLTKNHSNAEDLVQDTIVQALKSFHTYERGTNIKAWMMTIMYRQNSKQKFKGRQSPINEEIEDSVLNFIPFVPPVPQHITDEDIRATLEKLPQKFSEVVLLVDVEEFKYAEIAEILQIPIGTVMSRLHRGRKLLRVELAEYAESIGYLPLAK